MRAKPIPFDKQLELIMECRHSGLTDSQWCLEHDINPGTFYNWVKRHRQKACENIPPAGSGSENLSRQVHVQEIVRIDPGQLSAQTPEPAFHLDNSDVTLPHPVSSPVPSLEIELNGALIRISNDVSPGLLAQTLRILRGMPC